MDNEKIDKIIEMLQELKKDDIKIVSFIKFGLNDVSANDIKDRTIYALFYDHPITEEILNRYQYDSRITLYIDSHSNAKAVQLIIMYFTLKGYKIKEPYDLSSLFEMVK